jgi:hypothetical protein
MRLEGQVARLGERRNEYRVLEGKFEGEKQFGIPRGGLEYTIKMDLKKNGTG